MGYDAMGRSNSEAIQEMSVRRRLCGDLITERSLHAPPRADGVHRPVIRLAVRDESTKADDRVIDVLWEFVADRLVHLYVGLADEIIGGREAAEVGHSLQVPDDDLGFMQAGV